MTPEKIIQISTTTGTDGTNDIIYALTNYGNVYKMPVDGNSTFIKLSEFVPGKASKNAK